MFSLNPLSLLALFWILIAPAQVDSHEGAHEAMPEGAAETLSCAGGTAFLPDTARGEGTILLIVKNHTDCRIQIQGGVFNESKPLEAGHCYKRFISPGQNIFSFTAYRMHTYPWLKPLKEWFAAGSGNIWIEATDQSDSIFYAEIKENDIRAFSAQESWQTNWFQYLSLLVVYLVFPIFPGAALIILGIIIKGALRKEDGQ